MMLARLLRIRPPLLPPLFPLPPLPLLPRRASPHNLREVLLQGAGRVVTMRTSRSF
jgi:hypothetical protein